MRRAYHQAYRLHWQLSEGSLKPETQPTLTLEVLHFNSHFHMSVFKRVLVPAHKIHDVILQLKEMFYGLTRKEVQTLAFENAGGRLPPPFNKQNSNQKKWFHNFMKNFLIWALESQRAHQWVVQLGSAKKLEPIMRFTDSFVNFCLNFDRRNVWIHLILSPLNKIIFLIEKCL